MRAILISLLLLTTSTIEANAQGPLRLLFGCGQQQQHAIVYQRTTGPSFQDVAQLNYYVNHLRALQEIASNTGAIRDEIEAQTNEQARSLEGIQQAIQTRTALEMLRQSIPAPPTIQPVAPPAPDPEQAPAVYLLPQAVPTMQPRKILPQPGPVVLPRPMGKLPGQRMQSIRCENGTCWQVQPAPVRPSADLTPPTIAVPAAVVRIESKYHNLTRVGSGCHIGSGYVLSCAHVLKKRWTPTVITTDGREWPATILATDALSDLSLLKVAAERFDAKYIPVTSYQPKANDRAQLSGMSSTYQSWPGKVLGYVAADLVVNGVGVREGDSGGPICVNGAVVSVISEYTPGDRNTTGACSRDVVAFVESAGVKLGPNK